jgi:FkbM family methyltransferase
MDSVKRIKIAIQRMLNLFGYEMRKIPKVRPSDVIPIDVFRLVVQDRIDKQIRYGDTKGFFFIQIGAHDGLHYDPIRPWVKKYHWHGILVEPQPKIFKRLAENYRDEPQLILENAAVSSQDGQAVLYAFKETACLPDHATMLASFYRDALVFNGHNYRGEIEELIVPAISIQSLLSKHQVNRVDLLQIDTEGYDFEIIKMFDYTRIKPTIIHFESAGLGVDEGLECFKFLNNLGYRVLTIGVDSVAYIQEEDDDFAEKYENKGYK